MGKLSVWDKYVIENDKYSARKIVIDDIDSYPDEIQMKAIIDNFLLGEDLHLKNVEFSSEIEEKSNLSVLISETPLGVANNSKEKRVGVINKIIEGFITNENKKG